MRIHYMVYTHVCEMEIIMSYFINENVLYMSVRTYDTCFYPGSMGEEQVQPMYWNL